MNRLYLSVLVIAMFAFPANSFAAQLTLVNQTFMHTEAAGGIQTVALPGGFPTDLVAPDDFSTGTIYHRVTVNNLPVGANAAQYRFCFVQDAGNRACSDGALQFDAAGAVEGNQTVATFDVTGTVDWTAGLMGFEVWVTDTAGVPVDPTDMTWIGYPDYALYYPLEVLYEAELVSNGDVFAGFPNDNQVEAPTFSPPAGTYELQASVSITSATPDAMIYYTTDGSEPTEASTLFDGTAIDVTANTLIRARAYEANLAPSSIVDSDYTIVAQLTEVLRGRYYNGESFNDFVVMRTDPQIDFMFDGGTEPAPGVDGGVFSVIWTGQVTPLYSETYTFSTNNDDGTRLWVNNQLIIDNWNYQGPTRREGTISLQAGQQYSVWMEYFNGGGQGQAVLQWASSTQPEEVIPNVALDPNSVSSDPQIAILADEDPIEVFEIATEEPISISLRRRANLDDAVTVNLSYAGTAENGTDYQQLPSTVTFQPGELATTIEILPIDDDIVEGEETLIITLEDGDYGVSEPRVVNVIFNDNDVQITQISGQVIYTGTESGNLIVEAFRDTDEPFQKVTTELQNPGDFELTVEEGDYTVIAFVDTNGNSGIDGDEVWGIYQDEDGEPLKVTVPPSAENIVINLDVAPGTVPTPEEDEGCCATLPAPSSNQTLWVVLGLIVVVARRRKKSR